MLASVVQVTYDYCSTCSDFTLSACNMQVNPVLFSFASPESLILLFLQIAMSSTWQQALGSRAITDATWPCVSSKRISLCRPQPVKMSAPPTPRSNSEDAGRVRSGSRFPSARATALRLSTTLWMWPNFLRDGESDSFSAISP